MATCSSILAWEIPGTEDFGRGSKRVGHVVYFLDIWGFSGCLLLLISSLIPL